MGTLLSVFSQLNEYLAMRLLMYLYTHLVQYVS